MKSFLKISFLVVLNLSFILNAFAQVNQIAVANKLEMYEGEEVVINVSVSPLQNTPVGTVSNTLRFNPNIFALKSTKHPEPWIELITSPDSYTDTVNGVVKRTAGYPNGLTTTTKFVTYTLVAKNVGDDNIEITGNLALDDESNSIGINSKLIQIRVLPKKPSTPIAEKNTDSIEKDSVEAETEQGVEVVRPSEVPKINIININIDAVNNVASEDLNQYKFYFILFAALLLALSILYHVLHVYGDRERLRSILSKNNRDYKMAIKEYAIKKERERMDMLREVHEVKVKHY